tara:strand:+ start:1401 stop:2447 length:1047 start_codon:yes stop_codon:yes gene_type:complete
MKLLLPVAGRSSRFPGMRPKWLLTLPNGELMIERSLSGIDLRNVSEIVLIMLKEHTKYISAENIKNCLLKLTNDIPVKIDLLTSPTPSQPATIASYLTKEEEDFPFFIKDSDNYFEYMPTPENSVAYVLLSSLKQVDAGSKSYIKINKFDEIELIAEKSIISDKFCCGGYGFNSSKLFLESYSSLGGDGNTDLYVSHIIQKNLLDGINYLSHQASNYEDYGTSEEFFSCIRKVKSIFCDFDGVLVFNSSKFSNPPWQYKANEKNLNFISDFLKESPNSKLIITTSRPLSEKNKIIDFLKKYNINCHDVINDLPHAPRILINDFSKSNPYPTAQSISIPRDSENISDYF